MISSTNSEEEVVGSSCHCRAMSEEKAEREKEELRVFSQKLCSLLRLLLGERKMVQLGAPDVSPIDLLEKVLRLTGSKVTKEDDLCSEKSKVISRGMSLCDDTLTSSGSLVLLIAFVSLAQY